MNQTAYPNKVCITFRLRATAFVTMVCFIVTSFVGPAPPSFALPAEIESPQVIDPANLNIPAEFGTVREYFASKESGKPLIVYIQDAHAVYDAQRSIQGILA